jgi:hypothetical protein
MAQWSIHPCSRRDEPDLAAHGLRATVRQTEFGIKAIKVAGGTVKVKDEVRVVFDIHLAP